MYANITNPANFQLQDFAQFGFRVITTDFIPVPGEQYRTLYVLQDAVVTATTQKGDDITSKAILAGTLLHGLFNSVSITSGRVLAYAAGRVTAEEIIAIYEAYVVALGGTLENTQCAVDTINEDGVDFFADASLVMIPEGYATGVVYGQRPLASDSQLTFTRASDATRVGPDGAIAVVGSNIPRIDYTGGGCGKLLLEPQRTNIVTYSEQFNDAAWVKTNATVTANASPSPDGYQNADLFVPASGSTGRVDQVTSTASANNTTYTGSIYFKKPTLAIDNVTFYVSDTSTAVGSHRFGITVNLTNFTGAAFTFGNGVITSVSVVAVGNDWYRAIFTGSVTSGATGNWAFAARVLTTNATINGTNGLLIWGAQLEAGAYPTSYIPTTAAAVTRLADACSKTGISSLIGSSEGTVFIEIELPNPNSKNGVTFLQLGSSPNRIYFAKEGITDNVFQMATQSSAGYNFVNTANQTSATVKMAIGYKSGQNAFYVNGALISTASANANPTGISLLTLGEVTAANNSDTKIKQVLLFTSRLTNEQLQKLTSL